MLNLTLALDNEKTFLATERGLLLQGHNVLHTGILDTGNDTFFHISTAKILIFWTKEQKKHKKYMYIYTYVEKKCVILHAD